MAAPPLPPLLTPAAAAAAAPAAHPPPPVSRQIQDLLSGGPEAWWPLLGAAARLLVNLGIGAGMLLVTLWVADWMSKLAREAMGRVRTHADHQPDAVLQDFVASLVRYAIVVVGVIAVLQQVGVQTTSVLAVLGAASLAIGLALQGGLSNVAAGLMLLLLRPYRVGDTVVITGISGVVRGLDLFVTRLHDFDNAVVFIPNSKALGEVIVNHSMLESRRIVMDFGIDYEDNVDLALVLMLETARADPRVVADPPPWAKVTKLGDSAVTVTLRAWTSPKGYQDTMFDLIKAIKAAFEREGLSFAYPHQVAVQERSFTGPDKEAQRRALEARGGPPTSAPPAERAHAEPRTLGRTVEME